MAGAKAAIRTPSVRSGRRVMFVTVGDPSGPVGATFFEDAQESCAATVSGSWLLLVRGTRRIGRRGVSLRATGAWDLGRVHSLWRAGGIAVARALIASAGPDACPGIPGEGACALPRRGRQPHPGSVTR